MKIDPICPILRMHGSIYGKNAKWHVRTSPKGFIFSAHTGNPQKNPTARQLLQQERMREAVALYQRIIADAELTAEWNEKLTNQTRYKNLRALVIGSVLRGAASI